MRLILVIVAAILVGLPAFLIGGVHIQVQVLMAGLVCAWLFVLLVRPAHKGYPKRYVYNGVFWWLLAACCFTALQLIPLPAGLLAFLSPRTADIFSHVFSGFDASQKPLFQTLSLSPPETRAKLIRDITIWLLFMGAAFWGHRRWHLRMLLRVMVGAAMVLSALVALQTILRVSKPLMGLYSPNFGTIGLLMGSPLINLNHLGAYLLFHSLLAFVLSLDAEDKRQRWFWTGGGLWMGAMVFLTLSRGAVVAYLVGVVAFLFLVGRYASRRGNFAQMQEEGFDEREEPAPEKISENFLVRLWQRPGMRLLLLAFLLVAGVVTELASSALYDEFKQTSVSLQRDKLAAIYEFSIPLLKDFPQLGVGRGAMGMAWHRVSTQQMLTQGRVTATHVESFLLQPLVDWGIFLGLLWLLWGAWLLWRTWRQGRGFLERGAFLALLMLIVQNFADFNLEFLATSFPCFLLWGALCRQQHERSPHRLSRTPYLFAASLVLGAVLIGLCIPSAWRENYRRVEAQWSKLEELEPDSFRAGLARLLTKRPSDYVIPLLAARHYSKGRHWQPQEALKWLEKARYLNPTAGNIVLLRAYIHARLGLYQDACLDMELAVKMSPHLLSSASYLPEQFGFYKEALSRLRSSHLVHYVVLRMLRNKEGQALFLEEEDRLVKKFPKQKWLHQSVLELRLLEARKSLYSAKKETFEGLKKRLRAMLFRMHQVFPKEKGFLAFYKGSLLEVESRYFEAIRAYEEVLRFPKLPEFWRAYFALMELRLKLRQEDKLRAMFSRGRREAMDAQTLARLYHVYGRMFLRRYAYREALEAFEGALQHNASVPGYWFAVADVCVWLGFYQRALQIYRRFLSNPAYKESAGRKIAWALERQRVSRAARGVWDPSKGTPKRTEK